MSTTIRETCTKKYHKIQPVENRILGHCILILKILHDDDKSKNQIFNILKKDNSKIPYQSDKSSTLKAIKHLSKSELVREELCLHANNSRRRKRMKSQRIKVELTPLGKELSQLIYYLDRYELSSKELKKKINYHFDDAMMNLKPVVLQRRLKQKGWQSHEIEDSTLIEGVLILQTHLPLVLFNIILARYLKIIHSYLLDDLAKEILKRIIIDSITKYILDRLEGILADKINSNNSVEENAFRTTYIFLSDWLMSYIGNHVDIFARNRFIQEQSLELIGNLYHVLNPEKNDLQNMLKRKAKTDSELSTFIQVLESGTKLLRDNGFKS